jgi:hypothetical protein
MGDVDIEDLCALFLELKELCEDYNRNGVLALISAMRNGCDETREVLEKIAELVRRSDFDEAETIAADYLAKLSLSITEQVAETPHDAYIVTRRRLLQKGVPGLDVKKGLDRYDGDEEVYLRVLRSYAISVRDTLETVRVVSDETLNRYKISVHGIKGSSYDIFANSVGTKAEELEKAAEAENINLINEKNLPFLKNTEELIINIEELLAEIKAANPKPKKDKPDDELLLTLCNACEEYNINDVENAMSKIEQFQYEADDGLADWLRKNVDIMNFGKVADKLSYLK